MGHGNILLLKLLGQDLLGNRPTLRAIFRKASAKWRNEFLTDLSKLVVLLIFVWGGYLVVLYYLAAAWKVFADTPMGNIFATQVSPGIVVAITAVLDLDLLKIASICVQNTLLITLLIGLLLKFSGLYRLAFQNRGLLGVIFWGAACSTACARFLPIVENSGALPGNAAIYFLPTVSLLVSSVNLSARLVPEFTIVFQVGSYFRERLQIIKIRDLPHDQQEY